MTSLNVPQEPRSVRSGEEELAFLERRLRFGQAADREAAATLLAAEGRSAISPLVDSLRVAMERSVRLAAATSLCRIEGDPLDVHRLPEQVADEDLDFLLRIVRAQWRYGSAAPLLNYRMESSSVSEARCAVRAVVRLLAHHDPHSPEASELKGYLTKALGNVNREVRLEAVYALGRVDHPDALIALTPHLSNLANLSNRRLLIVSLAALLMGRILAFCLEGVSPSTFWAGLLAFLVYGGVTGLVFGLMRLITQRLSGSRPELEQVLAACSSQDPAQIGRIRAELARIASPLAGQSPEAQRQARELLRRVKTHEGQRGSLPIAASLAQTPFGELPKPAAAPEAERSAAVEVC